MRAACLLAALLASVASAEERATVVVMAAPPIDSERLADALRSYLDSFSIDVRAVSVQPVADLRGQLRDAEAAGRDVRAIAAIRVSSSASATVEIQVVDQITGKAVIASLPRLPRDEDFYRALALKMQALLRASFYEELDKVQAVAPKVVELVAPAPKPAPHRISLEAAYALVSFPLGELVQHGVSITGRYEIGRFVELSLAIDGLAPIRASRDDVTALVSTVPISLGVNLHLRRPRLEGAIGAVGELLVVTLDAESSTTTVRSEVLVAPALGIQAAGRVRLTAALWLYLRASVLGIATAERFVVRNQPLVDVSRLQVGLEAGLGVAVW